MKRKALLYTAFTIVAVASILFVLTLQFRSSWISTSIKEKIRGDELSYLYQDILKDGERALYISGKRAVIATINYELSNGTFFENANDTIANATLTGIIDGELQPIMENTTLEDWFSKISSLTEYRGLTTNITFLGIEVKPDGYMTISIQARANIIVHDDALNATINRSTNFKTVVSLLGIEDPFNTIESLGFVLNTFRMCGSLNGSVYDDSQVYGRAYVDYTTTDFSSIQEKENYILVTDTIDNKTNYTDFRAMITAEIPSANLATPHIFGVSGIDAILNQSLIVKVGGRVYLTNITFEKNNSCYFPWSSAPSILDRLEGRNYPDPKYFLDGERQGIASFIAVQLFPPELIKTSETHVLDYTYYPI